MFFLSLFFTSIRCTRLWTHSNSELLQTLNLRTVHQRKERKSFWKHNSTPPSCVFLTFTPCIWKCGAQASFLVIILGKSRTFIPNPGRNSHYKYQPSSFRISRSEQWQFKGKATLEFHESLYLLLYFLGYVFIFSNFLPWVTKSF